MEHENYIHIDNSKRGAKIYRIMSVDYLLDMFETKKNVLVKPCVWQDPFENFLFKTPVFQKNGEDYFSILRNRAYGQCWSLNGESDAMWRLYGPKENNVKVQTTISNLYNSLYQGTAKYPRMSCFIGEVNYHQETELTNLAKEVRFNGISSGGSYYQAKSLLMKRDAFKQEEEVRLIYLDPKNANENEIYSYYFDPLIYIKSIEFGPWVCTSRYSEFKEYFESLGFSGAITQSRLYKDMKLT